ncbi:MAG: phosphoglucosamine mutase [Candidatus Omnitrophica bacterium]|jgi:phosphomannomutase|nr:phosphoglucosamine mutase [Candidatus Omnitrophota bacterium]
MIDKNLIISTSGIRGIYGKTLCEKNAFDFGMAFGQWCHEKNIIIGTDTRPSRDSLKISFSAGVLSSGKNIIDIGIVPTPAIGFIIEKNCKLNGVIITASHNPQPYNGIKFFSSSGTFLNEEEFREFIKIYKKNKKKHVSTPGLFIHSEKEIHTYFAKILNFIDVAAIKKKKFRVVIDPCQGVGAVWTKDFLKKLGCDVIAINEAPIGIFSRNPEPTRDNLKELAKKVVEEKADIGFAQDPDCDRLVLVDEKGNIISEEYGVSFLIQHILSTRKKGPVVVNLSTTMLVDDICKKMDVPLYRTKVGEMYVSSKMKKVKAVCGGEGNGGIIYSDFHYGRDSFIGIGLALECLSINNSTLSESINKFPVYHFIKEKIQITPEKIEKFFSKVKNKFKEGKISEEDGLKISFPEFWFQLRVSKTEPIIRIFFEGKDIEKLQEIKNTIYHLLK